MFAQTDHHEIDVYEMLLFEGFLRVWNRNSV